MERSEGRTSDIPVYSWFFFSECFLEVWWGSTLYTEMTKFFVICWLLWSVSNGNAFPPLMEVPRVRLGLSVVRHHLRNTSCTVPHLPTKKLSCQSLKHSKASSISQAQLELGACVPGRSARDLETSV